MSNLPTSFCIDIVAEKEHKRLNEFKDWYKQNNRGEIHDFNRRYYGYSDRHVAHNGYLDFGALLSLDQFFTLLDPNPYTISDLANGVCAVVNDGDYEDLKKLLLNAFPKDTTIPVGENKYYFLSNNNPLCWFCDNTTNLPTQSVKLFLAELEKPEPITSINVGDEFMCVEDSVSKKGNALYTKGKVYRSERVNSITDNLYNCHHKWMYKGSEIKNVNRHFIRHQPTKEEAKEVVSETDNNNGLRYNNGKLRWSLVDFQSLEDLVKVLEFGASKYADHNWKKGLKTTEIFESMMRHMTAYISGEDNDQESGLSHIGHMMCNAMFLAYMQREKPEFDTRILKQIQNNK